MMIRRRHRGSVLAIVLALVTILVTSAVFLTHQSSETANLRKLAEERLQAHFAARGGLQHAMVKIHLMPTHLYDAAEFAIAKNPVFDFREFDDPPAPFPSRSVQINGLSCHIKLASNLNPGPRFLSRGSLTVSDTHQRWISTVAGNAAFADDDLVETPNLTPWPLDSQGNRLPNPSVYLWKFWDDINSSGATSMILDAGMAGNPFDFPAQSPYSANYHVVSMQVDALNQQRKYHEEAIRIVIVGEVVNRWGKTFTEEVSTTIRVQHQ
jgi:hypothetical protein